MVPSALVRRFSCLLLLAVSAAAAGLRSGLLCVAEMRGGIPDTGMVIALR